MDRSPATYTLFETVIGACAIAWDERALRAIILPGADDAGTIAKLRSVTGPLEAAAPPPWVRRAIEAIAHHIAGRPQDLGWIPLDTARATPFVREVYALCRRLPTGRTASYGELARQAGRPGAARAVGQVMARNPFPIVIPCHRVVASGGHPGGFSAHGGLAVKARLLAAEGADPAIVAWLAGSEKVETAGYPRLGPASSRRARSASSRR